MFSSSLNTAADTHGALLVLLAICVTWGFLSWAGVFLRKPKNIRIIESSQGWGKWLYALNFLVHANPIILKAYEQSRGFPFAVMALRNYLVLVSSPAHIQQVGQAPERVLSFNSAIKDRLEHSAIMLGFKHDYKTDADGAVTIRSVKILLRENIPNLSDIVAHRMKESFSMLLDTPLQSKGVMDVSVLAFTKAVLVKPCIQVSYGDELATNLEFNQSVLGYWWDSAYGSALCEVLPKSIAPYAGSIFMAWRGSMARVGRQLQVLLDKRLDAQASACGKPCVDLTQFVIASSRTPEQRDPVRLRQLLIAMTFVFAHQPPMSLAWAIIELGRHRVYIQQLRDEISRAETAGHADITNHLPLMESVLRESSRLHPLDSLTVQRKAMSPFTFSDGTHLPAGTLVAVPQQAILRDPAYYTDPTHFNPLRFNPYGTPEQAMQKWTDVNLQYPFWGSPAKACPGRWMASHMLKRFLVEFLKRYDFELLDPGNCKSVRWTTAVVPRDDIHISIKPRNT